MDKNNETLDAIALRLIARQQADMDTVNENDELISDLRIDELTKLVDILESKYGYEMYPINANIGNRTWQIGEIHSRIKTLA